MTEKLNNHRKRHESFWNLNPCDGHSNSIQERQQFRFTKEPWLLPILKSIAKDNSRLLEIGCGQGTDAYTVIEKRLSVNQNFHYFGIDLSSESIFQAKKDLYKFKSEEKIELELMVADTAKLPFQNEEFELIYSMGVLHHTNDITTSVSEIKRVLSIDGTAYFALYRTFSLKVLIALAIRKIQYLCDKILNKKHCFLWFYRKFTPKLFERVMGTALLECLGVPVLNSYSYKQVEQIFREFEVVNIESIGTTYFPFNLFPRANTKPSLLGYYWWIEVKNKSSL